MQPFSLASHNWYGWIVAIVGAMLLVLTKIAGKRDQLVGVLQQRYGYENERVETELDKFTHRLTS